MHPRNQQLQQFIWNSAVLIYSTSLHTGVMLSMRIIFVHVCKCKHLRAGCTTCCIALPKAFDISDFMACVDSIHIRDLLIK